jgi:hypothetical protein
MVLDGGSGKTDAYSDVIVPLLISITITSK